MSSFKLEKHKSKYILKTNQKILGEFIIDIDGFYVFFPSNNKGFYNEYFLNYLLATLVDLNKKWKNIIEKDLGNSEQRNGIDYHVRDICEYLNNISGVKTKNSCQGHTDNLSGYVSFVCDNEESLNNIKNKLNLETFYHYYQNNDGTSTPDCCYGINFEKSIVSGGDIRYCIRFWGQKINDLIYVRSYLKEMLFSNSLNDFTNSVEDLSSEEEKILNDNKWELYEE